MTVGSCRYTKSWPSVQTIKSIWRKRFIHFMMVSWIFYIQNTQYHSNLWPFFTSTLNFFKTTSLQRASNNIYSRAFLNIAIVPLIFVGFLWFIQSLRQLEHENTRMLNAKGELSEENASAYERLRKSYDQLFRSVTSWVSLSKALYFIRELMMCKGCLILLKFLLSTCISFDAKNACFLKCDGCRTLTFSPLAFLGKKS